MNHQTKCETSGCKELTHQTTTDVVERQRHIGYSRCAKCVRKAYQLARSARDRNLTAALITILTMEKERML